MSRSKKAAPKPTKFFLVQFLVEADVSEWPEFNDEDGLKYFSDAFKLHKGRLNQLSTPIMKPSRMVRHDVR
jgi:hypothetical protein